MTDQTAQEPTMEEILASIRRIISEDDAPAETPPVATAPVPAPEPEPTYSPALMEETPSFQEQAAADEDVLELTETYDAPASHSIGDLDVHDPEPEVDPFPVEPISESIFAHESVPVIDTPPHAANGHDTLVGEAAAAGAASAFASFASSLKKPEPMETPTAAGTGPTLDELARSLLRPMLKDWLDANLPAIVEAQVRKEVERIARSAG